MLTNYALTGRMCWLYISADTYLMH